MSMQRKEAVEYTLEKLQKAGADMAECKITNTRKTEMNVDAGEISLMRTNFGMSLYIKAIKDMKKGTITLNRATKEDIDKAVNDVIAVAQSSIADEAEGIAEFIENGSFDDGVRTPDKEALYDATKQFTRTVKNEYPKVMLEQFIVSHDDSESFYSNTNGVNFDIARGAYSYDCMFSAADENGTSSFNGASAAFTKFDKPFIDIGMTRSVLAESEKQIKTRVLDGKFSGTLLVTPACLDEILMYIIGCFAGDSTILEGTSIWKDKLGQTVADSRFSLRSEPQNADITAGYRMSDGYAVKDMSIIEKGILKNFVIGRYTAKKTGKARSANAGSCYVIEPGIKPVEQIIKETKRGIMLNRFSGGSPNANGGFTGVAKNSFLIDNGQVTDAVSETMVSGNLAEILQNIVDISAERINNGYNILPWIAFDGVTISGK